MKVDHEALRHARLRAGMSLRDVGGIELSRQAVQLIETGKIRPTMRSLEIIARRLGAPISTFLTGGSAVVPDPSFEELERLCHLHRYEDVHRAAQSALRQASGRPAALAHFYAGRALYHLTRPEEAGEQLRLACDLAEAADDPWLAAEAADWQAAARHLMDDVGALALGRDALRRYRELEGGRPEVEAGMLEHIGTYLTRRREFEEARACYEEALRVVGPIRDLEAMGRIYHGLAGCNRASGDLRQAADLMRRAVTLYSVEADLRSASARISLPKAENDLGMLLMEMGQLSEAEELMTAAHDHFASVGVERLRAYVLLSTGQLRWRQGRLEEAFSCVREAVELSEALGQAVTLAVGEQQLGELHAARGEHDQVRACFGPALAILAEAGLETRRAQCQAAYDRLRAEREPARSVDEGIRQRTG